MLLIQAVSYANDAAIMKVFLNEEEKGDVFLVVTSAGDVLVSPGDLKELGFREAPAGQIEQGRYVSLVSLAPAVRFSVEEGTSSLHIIADPGLLKKTRIDFAYREAKNVSRSGDNAGFLNYGFYYSGSGTDASSFNVPLELGVNVDGVLGFSSFSYARTRTEETSVRLLSNITADSPEHNRRLVLGDFFAVSGPLGSGGLFGGVSVSKNFSTTPYLIRFPGLDVSGLVQTPSEARIYINDALVRSERLSPGEFELLNLSTAAGAGHMTLVLRDAAGHEQTQVTPFHISAKLLKPGLQDYSYNFGFRRAGLGQESFRYQAPAFLAGHRLGVSKSFTAGVGTEADHHLINIAPTATFLLPWASQVDATLAFSSEQGNPGLGGLVNYFHVGRKFAAGFSAQKLSRNYSNLALRDLPDKPRLQMTASVSLHHPQAGAVSLAFSQTETHQGQESKTATAYYSRALSKDIFFYVSLYRSAVDQTTHGVFAGLSLNLGQRRNGTAGYQVQDDAGVSTLALQQSPPSGMGSGYRLYANRRQADPENPEGGGSFQYKGSRGIYSAGYQHGASQDNYLLGLAGGVAAIDHSLYFTRPITDSFALVSVGELQDVGVYHSNQLVGKTDKRGKILLPNLVSYYDNKVSIDDSDIPINYTVPQIERYVVLPYRGGGIVKFDATKLRSFEGRMFFVTNGQKQSADYAGLEIRIGDKVIETVVGKGGEFYLENLPVGRLPSRVFSKGQECSFDLTIPDSNEAMVDLGEVTCETP